VAGASGLVGRALVASLRADGVAVTRLVRRRAQAPDEVEWLTDPTPLDPAVLDGADAVVGLNGASIGRMPWTARYRSALLWSRITPTRTLAAALRRLGASAPAFVSASAVGYYGSAPGRRLTEDSPRGDTFLADLCGEWEGAARRAGGPVAHLRTAPIVHAEGVLRPLLVLTRLGLAGPLGGGTQTWPWISLEDEVRAIRHVIDNRIEGPVNLAGPARATANDLGFALAIRMNRPYLVRAPRAGLRLVLGRDAADSVLLADAHVVPAKLKSTSFRFLHATVEDAVAQALPAQDADRSAASSRSD
jgi:uncharacterized protein (TIGR01777 family)